MTPLRVIVIEDSSDDYVLLIRSLRQGGYEPISERVETADVLSRMLDERMWDLVLADYELPNFNAIQALAVLKEKQLDIPFIIVSGNIGEVTAVAAMRAGAHDYIMKGNTARLIPAIGRELREVEERQTRRKAEQALGESESRFRSLIEHASDITTVLDAEGTILYESPSIERLLGHRPGDLIGRRISDYIHPEDVAEVERAILEREPAFEPGPIEFRFRHQDGSWCFLEATGRNLLEEPSVQGIVVNCRDVTARKRDEETIRHLAYYDGLTGLPNRTLFHDRLKQSIAHARRTRQHLAVMFLDLDRFKTINDTLGHGMGDLLLGGVGGRLASSLREDDTVARLGGDEFAILLGGFREVEDLAKTARKILDALKPPFAFEGHELHITASIGISMFPADGEDAETLVKNADTALYRAKDQGRNTYQLYTPGMNAIAFERLVLENSLRRAVERDELMLYYQPLVDSRTSEITGFEALVRWQHPDLGLILPMQFIPMAEETGLIIPISEWVLRTACAQCKAWQQEGLPPMRMAVNLSARHFNDRMLPATIATILEQTGLEPRFLTLELTESTIMESGEATMHTLQALKQMGIDLSIDDFGTGYSSLSYLKRLPIDTLKIDRSFVRDISTNPDDAAISTLIIAMAHSLNLKVVAEGVETKEQLAFLGNRNCDQMQGFLFSQPLKPEAVVALFANGSRKIFPNPQTGFAEREGLEVGRTEEQPAPGNRAARS